MYDEAFWAQEGDVAFQAARVVMPWMRSEYPFATVIDIGGGTGQWAFCAREVTDGAEAVSVDLGVPITMCAAGVSHIDADLINGWPCSGYDLAICLEVAEHLPESTGPLLIEGLAQAPTVLFSAATPGQPGVGHINCQPHDYWHDLFATHGKTPRFIGDLFADPVADFYRRNMHVYV